MSVQIQASVAPKIGFASQQNAVAILQELVLRNEGEEAYEDLACHLQASPGFLEPKIWKLDALGPGDELNLSDRDVRLEAGFLYDLVESLSGEIEIEVRQGDVEGELLARQSHSAELLARTQWGGTGSMPELLPAFCMPNDPAVDKILKSASDVLRRAGKESGIDGYQRSSRSRTWELVSAIWTAVEGLRLGYAMPPASFEAEGQKIRTPGAILEGQVATCLDSALLFCSALEQAGLNPLIILSEGHASVGVWLQPQEFTLLTIDEAAAIRKRVELKELVVFETTLVTKSPAPPFSTAVKAAEKELSDEKFHLAIDIRQARKRRIRPLGLPAPRASESADADSGEAEPVIVAGFEEAPALPAFDVEVTREPENANDRVAQWQRKLLDLTTRNRLLHLPERSKHVPIECPDPGRLEDLLAAGKTIRISAFPDLEGGGRDSDLYEQQTQEDLWAEYAKGALDNHEVLSKLDKKKLEAALIDLYRKANTDLAEGGANTLFLALGFLKWKKSAEDTRVYQAPLILMPVQLKRKSALTGVTMVAHEDEPRFNLTLLELLKQDFELEIGGLDGALPEDESGIDVAGVWNQVRHHVKEIPGFEVTKETAIGTFSFAKYLMWKDLTDRREQLMTNKVVRYLIERGEEKFTNDAEYPADRDLDRTIDPSELFAPLPADSSQLAAVVASGRGCSFVLDGPPGTGKSQTIANMIVHNLALGRRVLFVAEKMAALDVVHRRLKEKGLGEFCLEVHSHKASKLDVIHQLDRAWDTQGSLSSEAWQRETARLRGLRDRLNAVCQRLHQPHPNGMSLHDAVGKVVRDHEPWATQLRWGGGPDHTREQYETMESIARRIDLNFADFSEAPSDFSVIEQLEWSNAWQESLLSESRGLPGTVETLLNTCTALLEACQFSLKADDEPSIDSLLVLVGSALAAHGLDLSFAFTPNAQERLRAIETAKQQVEGYRQDETGLSAPYPKEAARRIEPDALDAAWSEASGKIWPLRLLAQRKVTKDLIAKTGASGKPCVPEDTPILRRLKERLEKLDELKPLLAGVPGYADLDSNLEQMETAAQLARQIQQQATRMAANPDALVSIQAALKRLVVDANALLGEGGAVAMAFAALKQCLGEYREAFGRWTKLCGIQDPSALTPAKVTGASVAISENEKRLRAWCNWQKIRQDARIWSLGPLIEDAEQERIPAMHVEDTFKTAYAKWFASEIIDLDPVLREFVAVEHLDAIEEFRKVDDQVALLTAEYARAMLSGKLPTRDEVSRRDGFGILKHEVQKKRRHKPLRQLAEEMGEAFTRLAPCMLMSPLSIAQYLPPDQALFDLVIFDEASQITPWDAVGSIARGKEVVVAGDPRQMPPTNFFQRGVVESEFDDSVEEDQESVLEECLGVGIPRHQLTWHYRSHHESLIAFSNHKYYGGRLVTFPAAETRESAVSWRQVDGIYAKGASRTNEAEAKAIVKEAVDRLLHPGFSKDGLSLAIITLNAEQQRLIEDLLDEARREHPEIEPFFGDDLSEPVVVKNLETVQGDERDVILLGIGYGPTEPGAKVMSMNFGPLNRDGGERRLNVAVTRARRELVILTSFDPSMMDLNRTGARAVRDLKLFIEYAERGPKVLGEAVQGSLGGYESPLEEAVATRLQEKGWEIVPQVGVSRYRIDLGIVHPTRKGDFLAGVECDGASYHSSATARDRDKVRSAVLEGLGWKLLRVWSTDWFLDRELELERLDQGLRDLLEADEAEAEQASEADEEAEPAPQATDEPSALTLVEATHEPSEPEPVAQEPARLVASNAGAEAVATDDTEDLLAQDEPLLGSVPTTPAEKRDYLVTDLSTFEDRIRPEEFYDDHYTPVLRELIDTVLKTEAPIQEDLLVNRIARAHGFKRSGRLIRERVLEQVDRCFFLQPDPVDGNFAWLDEEATQHPQVVRLPTDEDSTRSIDEIPAAELLAARTLVHGDDPPKAIASLFGVSRLRAASRERIESALYG